MNDLREVDAWFKGSIDEGLGNTDGLRQFCIIRAPRDSPYVLSLRRDGSLLWSWRLDDCVDFSSSGVAMEISETAAMRECLDYICLYAKVLLPWRPVIAKFWRYLDYFQKF